MTWRVFVVVAIASAALVGSARQARAPEIVTAPIVPPVHVAADDMRPPVDVPAEGALAEEMLKRIERALERQPVAPKREPQASPRIPEWTRREEPPDEPVTTPAAPEVEASPPFPPPAVAPPRGSGAEEQAP